MIFFHWPNPHGHHVHASSCKVVFLIILLSYVHVEIKLEACTKQMYNELMEHSFQCKFGYACKQYPLHVSSLKYLLLFVVLSYSTSLLRSIPTCQREHWRHYKG
jgi:hypothetical protein